MSNDKRLGVNPLSWVDPEASIKNQTPTAPETAEPDGLRLAFQNKAEALYGNSGRFFTSPSTITEEDFMGKDKVKIKQVMNTVDVIAHLEDLAQSLGAGILRAEDGKNSVVLCTDEAMNFEMKISLKKGKAKCSISMEWDDDGSKAETFKISDK